MKLKRHIYRKWTHLNGYLLNLINNYNDFSNKIMCKYLITKDLDKFVQEYIDENEEIKNKAEKEIKKLTFALHGIREKRYNTDKEKQSR